MRKAPGFDVVTRALLTFLLWNVFGFLIVTHYRLRGSGAPTFAEMSIHILPFYWVWALLTPILFHLGRRFDPFEGPRVRSLGAHMMAAVCVTLTQCGLYILLIRLLIGDGLDPCLVDMACLLRTHGTGDVATYVAVVGGYVGMRQYRRADERERRTLSLEAQLANARLSALAMQLHPHFLFNALNTVSVLVLKGDGRSAIRAISRLADLLRRSLASGFEQETTLAEEMAFVEAYLDIERLRFGSRLHVDADVAAEVEDARVPRLILQPLVENAVRHGLGARTDDGGCIRVTARRRQGALELQVADNGPPPERPLASAVEDGVGLGNVRARLAGLYGTHARLWLAREGEWTTARMEVPLRTES